MSLYSMVSRSAVGRFGRRQEEDSPNHQRSRTAAARLQGASMWLLEAGLAATAIATAILIGAGR